MDTRRIFAIMYRHLRPTMRDSMRILDMFYWPLLDIVLWGFTSAWLANLNPEQGPASSMLLTGLVLWQVVFRASIEVTRNLLEELWHQNFINLFASPLKLSEWITAIFGISLINSSWNLLFGAAVVGGIFQINILSFGVYLLPYFFILLLFGWFCGLMASCAILSFGRRVEMIAWSFPWFFSPFSCVFYPITVLPVAVQKLSWLLPSTYVFESMRDFINRGAATFDLIIYGVVLALVFFTAALLLFVYRFRRARERGLNTLE